MKCFDAVVNNAQMCILPFVAMQHHITLPTEFSYICFMTSIDNVKLPIYIYICIYTVNVSALHLGT